MPRRMSRRQNTAQSVAAPLQNISILQEHIAVIRHGPGILGGIAVPKQVHFLLGKSLLHISRIEPAPGLFTLPCQHALSIHRADIHPAARTNQLRRQARMIAVQMGEEHIHPVPVHPDFCQLPLHGFPARFLTKSCIDQ